MPDRWLVKSDPDAYSFADLVRDRKTTWDGVANALALKYIRAMRKGDEVLVYATGKEKAVIGRATCVSDGYGDPAVVDLAAGAPLARPVTLAEVKADPFFADFALVRIGRLSVMPVTGAQWKRILEIADRP